MSLRYGTFFVNDTMGIAYHMILTNDNYEPIYLGVSMS